MFGSIGISLQTPETWPQLPLCQDPPQAVGNYQNTNSLSDAGILMSL